MSRAPRPRTSSSSISPASSIGTTSTTRRGRSCFARSGVRRMRAPRISGRSSSPRTPRSARSLPLGSPDTRRVPAPHEELHRAAVPNAMGHVVLAFAERVLGSRDLAGLREQLWRSHTYLYVTPGPLLVRRALEGFPAEVRALAECCPFHRYDARGGGGYWPDRNEIWLAAGVETYEGLRQVRLSACHELFHFV